METRYQVYKLSNGKEVKFYTPQGKYSCYVNDQLFPGFNLKSATDHFKAIWFALGLGWKIVTEA